MHSCEYNVMFMLFFRAGSLKLCILPVEYTLLMMR